MSFGGKPSTPSPKSQSPRSRVEPKGDAKARQRSVPSSLGDKSPRTKDGAAQETEAKSPHVKSPSKGVTPAADLLPPSPTSGDKQVKRRVRSSLGVGDETTRGLNSSPAAAAKVDEKKSETKMDDKNVSKQDEKVQPLHSDDKKQPLKSEERKQQSPKLDAKKQPLRHDIKKDLRKSDERKVTGKPDAKSPVIKTPVAKPTERKPLGSSEKKHQSPSPVSSSQKTKPVGTVPGGPPEGQGIVSKMLSPSSASKSQVQSPVVPKSSAGKSVEEDLWTCRECGWTYPNPHPSAKHRRNHKKHCSEIKAKKEKGHHLDGGSSSDASSDDESPHERGKSAKPVLPFVEPGDVTTSPPVTDSGVRVVDDVQLSGLSSDGQEDTALPKEGIQAQRLDKDSLRSLSVKARVEDYEKRIIIDESSPRTPGKKNVLPRGSPYSSPAKRLLFPEMVPILEPPLDHVADSGPEDQVASQPAEATSNPGALDDRHLQGEPLDTVVSSGAGEALKDEALQSSFSDAPEACKKLEEPETSTAPEAKTGEFEIGLPEVHTGEVNVLDSAGQGLSSNADVEFTEVLLEESKGLQSCDLQGGGAEKSSTEVRGCDPGVIEGGAAEQLESTTADTPQKAQSEVPGDTHDERILQLSQAVDSEPELATQAEDDEVVRKDDMEKDLPESGNEVFAPGVAESHDEVQFDELSSVGAETGTSTDEPSLDSVIPETVQVRGGEADGILEPSEALDHDAPLEISGVELDPELTTEVVSDLSKGSQPPASITENLEPSLAVDRQLECEDEAHHTDVRIASQLEDTGNEGPARPAPPVVDSEQILSTRAAMGEEPLPEVAPRKVTFADDLKAAEDNRPRDDASSLSVDVDLMKPSEPESAQELSSSMAEPSSCDPVVLHAGNGVSDEDVDSSRSVALAMERDPSEADLVQSGVESSTAQSDTSAVEQEDFHEQALGENDGLDAAVVQSQTVEPEANPEIEPPVTQPLRKVQHGTGACITESREKELWEQLLDNDLKHYSAESRSDVFPAEDSWKPEVEEKLLQNSGRLTADLQGDDIRQHSKQETEMTNDRSAHAESGVTESITGQGVLDETHIQEGVDRNAAPEAKSSLASTISEHNILNQTAKELSETETVAPVVGDAKAGTEIPGGRASPAHKDSGEAEHAASPVRVQPVTSEGFSKCEVSVENGGQAVEKPHHHRLRNLLEEEHVAEHLEVQPSQETKVVASPKSPFLKRIIERVRSSPPSVAENAAKETGNEDAETFPRAKRSMFSCQCFSPTDPK